MLLLGYSKWEHFKTVIQKAKIALKSTSEAVENHFPGVRKMVSVGYGNKRAIKDYKLSRYACYLIAQNGDSRKPAIAAAQVYFAVQTRRQEVEDKAVKRIAARKRLTATEKRFSGVMHQRHVDGQGIAEIRSAGDEKLFGGSSTQEMKARYGIKDSKPIADVMPTVGIRAKDLATEMTTINTEDQDLRGKQPIKQEHVANNAEVREALLKRKIHLENLPPEEDTKKLERQLKASNKQIAKKQPEPPSLSSDKLAK